MIWQRAQIRPMLESEALERIEEKLERLGGGRVTRLYGGTERGMEFRLQALSV